MLRVAITLPGCCLEQVTNPPSNTAITSNSLPSHQLLPPHHNCSLLPQSPAMVDEVGQRQPHCSRGGPKPGSVHLIQLVGHVPRCQLHPMQTVCFDGSTVQRLCLASQEQ